MALSVDIHRIAFIIGSAKDQSDSGWLLAHFLNHDGVRGNAPSLRQHPPRVACGRLNSAWMRAPDMGLNDGYQLIDDSRAHAARDPDADFESGSILTGGVVAPSLIQDELVRSQDPFDGVDQPVPIPRARPLRSSTASPLAGPAERRGTCSRIGGMRTDRHVFPPTRCLLIEHFSVGRHLSRPTSCPIALSPKRTRLRQQSRY
jgi:hypothetical protein